MVEWERANGLLVFNTMYMGCKNHDCLHVGCHYFGLTAWYLTCRGGLFLTGQEVLSPNSAILPEVQQGLRSGPTSHLVLGSTWQMSFKTQGALLVVQSPLGRDKEPLSSKGDHL